MTHREHILSPADAAQFCQEWSGHLDALEKHLSAKAWALAATIVVVLTYPIARILLPDAVHDVVSMVPDVVRTVLHLM